MIFARGNAREQAQRSPLFCKQGLIMPGIMLTITIYGGLVRSYIPPWSLIKRRTAGPWFSVNPHSGGLMQ
jgi:hypothetical protein